jgi:type I restriction-modification system DNA methylase subunit
MTEKKSYPCEHCLRVFLQKNDYMRHINKKYPCVTKEQLKELNDNELIDLKEKMTETDALKFLESFFNKIKDLLRDQESITSDRALDVITDFLFLRLLNYEMDTNKDMDFITKKYNQKVKINNYDYEIDEYKKYFKWETLMELVNLIDRDSSNQENKQLLVDVISFVIFGGIFKFNDNTKEIYKNRRFFVKKLTTIQRLLKEYNKIDFTKYDVDIKGKAYEMILQKESVTNSSFGQYFTPNWIDKYMVSNAKIKINKDGSYTKIFDPACGTAGILCEYYAEVKRKAEKEKIKLDKNVSEYVFGCEIVDDTLKLAHMNMLLKSGSYNTNLKNVDFLEVECLDYVDEKLDANIIMNPPFALTKKYHLYDDDISKNIFYGETKSGTMLFLMAGLNSIKDGNQLIMVSPNGKEIFSKTKEYSNIRKKTMEIANVYRIAILPDCSFKPYTSVQTLILMMEKGKKTDKIEFVKLEKDKDSNLKENKICSVKYKDIEKKNYSWNYKEYYSDNTSIKYENLKYIKLNEICEVNIGGTPSRSNSEYFNNGNNLWVQISDLKEKYISITKEKITDDAINNSSVKKINKGDILLSFKLTIGKVAIADDNMYCNEAIAFFRGNEYVNTNYLFYYFLTNDITQNKKGSIGNGALNKEDLKNLEIPIPPIEVQNQIVNELDSYYRIKENMQNTLNDLEIQKNGKFELLLNSCKDTKLTKLGEILDRKSGKSLPKDDMIEGEFPVIGGGEKYGGYHNDYNYDEKLIFISRVGTAGYVSKYNGKCYITDLVGAFTIKKNYNYDFTYYYLKFKQEYIQQNFVNKAAAPSINLGELLDKYEISIPSLEDQEAIIKEMEYFDKLKETLQQHISNTTTQIKERFEYYLNKCKNASETKDNLKQIDSNSNELDESNNSDLEDSDLEEETKSKKNVKKTIKAKKSPKKEEEKELKTQDEKIKKKSKKSSKKEEDNLSELEKELEMKNEKKIIIDDKKVKKNKSKINVV